MQTAAHEANRPVHLVLLQLSLVPKLLLLLLYVQSDLRAVLCVRWQSTVEKTRALSDCLHHNRRTSP